MSRDYLAMVTPKPEDKVDHGVKGMKWGIRRSPAQLSAAAKKSGEGESSSTKPSGPETASQRYSRLKAQAKAGKGNEMDEADLKFFNARTEALSKVAKLNEQKPGWLAETTKAVVQQSAKRQLQMIADSVADKYINERLIAQLNKSAKK